MSETKALAVAVPQQLTLSAWEVIKAIAPTMHQARLFGVTSQDQAAAIMVKGAELGLSFSASFEFIQVIQGKPTLSPRGALALLMNSGELAGFKLEATDTFCRVSMKRRSNGFEHAEEFTIEDAKRAQLIKPDSGWEKYPQNMLKWRAIGFCIDVLFADVTGGMKRADEFGATVDAAGNVVAEGTYRVLPPAAPMAQATRPTLDDLVARYGVEAVLVASLGFLPATDGEIAIVARKLVENESTEPPNPAAPAPPQDILV